jgi:hypothetical protein
MIFMASVLLKAPGAVNRILFAATPKSGNDPAEPEFFSGKNT